MGGGTDVDLLDVANSVPPLIGQGFSVSSVYELCILEFDFEAGTLALVASSINNSDSLGDLLLHMVFYAKLGEEITAERRV